MADQPKKPKGRRGFKVGDQSADQPEEEKRGRPRSVADALRLANKLDAAEAADGKIYPPQQLEAFLAGRITLGDLEGITKQEQYQMAEIGHNYLTSGKLDEAKTMFEGLLALDPFDAYFNTALGSIAQQQERLDDSEKLYSRALEINPFSCTAHGHRGEVRLQMGRLEEAIADLIKAVELDPKNEEPAAERARATLFALQEQLSQTDFGAMQAAEAQQKAAAEAQTQKAPVPRGGPAPRGAGPGPRRVGGAGPRPRTAPRVGPGPRIGSPRGGPRGGSRGAVGRGPRRGPGPRRPSRS